MQTDLSDIVIDEVVIQPLDGASLDEVPVYYVFQMPNQGFWGPFGPCSTVDALDQLKRAMTAFWPGQWVQRGIEFYRKGSRPGNLKLGVTLPYFVPQEKFENVAHQFVDYTEPGEGADWFEIRVQYRRGHFMPHPFYVQQEKQAHAFVARYLDDQFGPGSWMYVGQYQFVDGTVGSLVPATIHNWRELEKAKRKAEERHAEWLRNAPPEGGYLARDARLLAKHATREELEATYSPRHAENAVKAAAAAMDQKLWERFKSVGGDNSHSGASWGGVVRGALHLHHNWPAEGISMDGIHMEAKLLAYHFSLDELQDANKPREAWINWINEKMQAHVEGEYAFIEDWLDLVRARACMLRKRANERLTRRDKLAIAAIRKRQPTG